MIVQEPVQAAIWHCLNSYAYTDATFLAERLYAEVSSSESIFLLATAYHRSGESAHANYLLRCYGPRTPKLRFLLGVTAHSLSKLQEAENVLVEGLVMSSNCQNTSCAYDSSCSNIPMLIASMSSDAKLADLFQEAAVAGYGVLSSFVLRLLGDIYRQTQRINKACAAYRAALAINPFLFNVYMQLLDICPSEKSDKLTGYHSNIASGSGSKSAISTTTNNNNLVSVDANNSISGCSNANNLCTGIDTNPETIFTLDNLTDLTNCHGNTLCSVINGSVTCSHFAVSKTNSLNLYSSKGTVASRNSFVSGSAPLSSARSNAGGSVPGGHHQITTPLTNIMMNNSQLYTPIGDPFNPFSSTTHTPSGFLPHQLELHKSPTLFQAPRKKRFNPIVSSTSPASRGPPASSMGSSIQGGSTLSPPSASIINNMLSMPPPVRHLNLNPPLPAPHNRSQQDRRTPHSRLLVSPMTPSFGVLPLDLTGASLAATPCETSSTTLNYENTAWDTSVASSADPPADLLNLSFASTVDDNASVAVLSPLVFSPLEVSSHPTLSAPVSSNPQELPPPPLPPKNHLHHNLARRVLCRSSNNSAVPGSGAGTGGATSGAGTLGTVGGSAGNIGGGGQTGNTYHHSPSSTHTSVRRSSRLFLSSSVKENNKSRVFVPPKSPVRRSKPRSLRCSSSSASVTSTSTTTSPMSASSPSNPVTGASQGLQSAGNTSLIELNNARNTNSSLCMNSNSLGGENIMPCIDSALSLPSTNILMPSAGTNNKNFSSSGNHQTGDLEDKPAPAPLPVGSTGVEGCNVTYPPQPVLMLSQEELSKQALSIQKQAAEGLMALFRQIAAAYRLFCRYQCQASIEALQELPPHHVDTAFVHRCIAKAYFHINDFSGAVKYFERVCQLTPQLVMDLEYYSTALWHLQKEVELSALAQILISVSRQKAAGWCAVGNCFSLQKEHETAIKFFTRAVQVEPECSYAYTLLGHEHIATDELDRALDCYRTAVKISPRHYNAWYGIGLVLYKKEEFAFAEINFRKALSIHPNSCVLLCHIAVVQHSLGRSNSSLQTLSRALALEPSNAMCRYHRACIFLELAQPSAAMADLKVLQPLVPKEANVFMLLGKAYHKLGNPVKAQMHFSWAQDLDPKGAASSSAAVAAASSAVAGLGEVLDDGSAFDISSSSSGGGAQESLLDQHHELDVADPEASAMEEPPQPQQDDEDFLMVAQDMLESSHHMHLRHEQRHLHHHQSGGHHSNAGGESL